MKKLTKVIAIATMAVTMFTSTASAVKMYAPDGRTASVMESDVAAWKAKGWSTKNYKTMYAPDGRTAKVLLPDVKAWKKVGWYEVPVAKVYTLDGRSQVIAKSDVSAWKKTGWYLATDAIPMFGTYGEIKNVSVKDVAAWKKVGWKTDYKWSVWTASGREVKFTVSDVYASGYNYSLGEASEMAKNYCKTYMSISWEDIYYAAEWMEMTPQEVVEYVYSEASLLDYNYNHYLISVNSIDCVEFISVNKFTGETRYIGGGQDYMRGYYGFN